MTRKTRRHFIKTTAAIPFAASQVSCKTKSIISPSKEILNEEEPVKIASIGMGIMGFSNCKTALKIPGVTLVAACDLYSGRLTRAKEIFGSSLSVTTDYKDIINRGDVDAVIISTSDHWHDKMTIAALNAGKHVYCEKPMVHHIEEGRAVIEAEKTSGKILQIGSQRVSSELYAEAGRQYRSGVIGDLVVVEATFDRQSPLGAWQYSIPTDASAETVDWDRFIGDASKREFDENRFFRWRNYQEYGTGVSGDMLVHFFSGFHAITASIGPNRIYATGGLRHWTDGRDVPDNMMALVDYPNTDQHSAFNAQLRVNFVDGKGGGSTIRMIGSEGMIDIKGSHLTVTQSKMPSHPEYGGWDSYQTFSENQQQLFKKQYEDQYPNAIKPINAEMMKYELEDGYDTNYQHHLNFYNAIRGGGEVVEDGTFGLRAAAPALAANKSYFEKRIIEWDPIEMKIL